jgi:hypothetical protein
VLKDRLKELFKEYELDVQDVIAAVLELEQEHISKDRPRVKQPIRQIIDRAVTDEPGDQV